MRQLLVLVLAGTMALILALGSFGGAEAQAARGMLSTQDRLVGLQQELASLREDVEDLKDPVKEFDLFDKCMFTMRGVKAAHVHGERLPPLLAVRAVDVAGAFVLLPVLGGAEYDFLAFPGEEPPQIECNEDAGGQDTDE